MLSRLNNNDVFFVLKITYGFPTKFAAEMAFVSLRLLLLLDLQARISLLSLYCLATIQINIYFFGNFVQCCVELCLSHNFYWELIVLALLRDNVKQNLCKINIICN